MAKLTVRWPEVIYQGRTYPAQSVDLQIDDARWDELHATMKAKGMTLQEVATHWFRQYLEQEYR